MRIKCPHCNGKGFSEINSALNLTCGWCMGQGELDIEVVPAKENMTNEEWFCSLTTAEKAKWLYDHYVNARAEEFYGRQEKTLSEYQKWLVSVHRGIDGTKID